MRRSLPFVPGAIFRRSVRLKQQGVLDAGSKLIQKNSTEPDVDLFMNITH